MKKLLVVLLAVVLVFGLATSAFAYTDTDDLGTVQQDSIYRLSALGVLNGYPDGTFGATSQITRAEFAKMACELAGLGDVSDVLKNTPSSFSDVAAGAWYTGYINVAASQGFINGYPDGTFLPNNNISMAEVVTILMRVAGYNDNLPGPWPFDYIAEAGKQDVTDDVTFVSNLAATRSDVAVMSNNALDMILVNWDSDSSKFVEDEDDTTVMDDSFGATTSDVMFDNSQAAADVLDGWNYSDFDEDEITLSGTEYDEDSESYDGADFSYVMSDDCYIAGGMNLTDLGGMTADVITNDDDEVIYVKPTSSFEYTDDVEGTIASDNVEVNGDSVDAAKDFASFDADNAAYDYAKVFYNEDGDVYAIEDLEGANFAADVALVDNYDDGDEVINVLDGSDVDLEDTDAVILKDGEAIDAADLNALDVIYVFGKTNGAEQVVIVADMAEGALTEGTDDSLTIGDNDYYYDENSQLNLDGGVDGAYSALTSLKQLDDVFDNDVQVATTLNPYQIAYLVADITSSTHVYGIVTDMTVGGLFNKVQDVTILNQDGEEVTYDVDNGDNILTYGDEGNVELGAYVDVRLDADGVIDTVDDIILASDVTDLGTMDVSGSKIKIDGTWYKVNDDTLFFETQADEPYASEDFDEADLISVDDVLAADDVTADLAIIVSHDGATLERVFLVNSDLNSGNDSYSFVDRLYTNADGSFVKMMDGTVAERKDGEAYDKDVFYAYDIVGGEMTVTKIFATDDANTTSLAASPYEDAFWVKADGSLAAAATELGNLDVVVDDLSGDTLTLAGDYYTITADTQIFTIDSSKVVDTADDSDIDDGDSVLAISDEDGNLLYVFVLAAPIVDVE